MDGLFGILLLLAGVFSVVSVIRRRKEAMAAYPEVEYEKTSSATSESWRWRKPRKKLGLTLKNSSEASSLLFSHSTEIAEGVAVAFGYLMGVGLLFVLVGGTYDVLTFSKRSLNELWLFLPAGAFGAWFVWVLLHVGSHLEQIDLQPTQVVFVICWGIFWRRKVSIPREPRRTCKGKLQGAWEMHRDQENPSYKLFIQRAGWMGLDKRILLRCNQSQGSWIVGGLNAWFGSSETGD